jgi:hypothetical protein
MTKEIESTQIKMSSPAISMDIEIESPLMKKVKPFGQKFVIVILVIIVFILYFVNGYFSIIPLLLIPINIIIRNRPTNLTLTSEAIGNYFESRKIKHKKYFDFYINVKDEKAQIQFLDYKFTLNNLNDIAVLTTGVAKFLDLEFEAQFQLENKSEVLTYHRKNIRKIEYESNISFHDNITKISVFDLENTSNRFIIHPNLQRINYEKEVGSRIMKAEIEINKIEKIIIEVHQRSTLFINERRLIVKVYEKQQAKTISKWQQIWEALNNTNIHNGIIFVTSLRSSEHELMNFRDGEKLYQFLKNLPILKNILIEKQIII